MDPLFVSETVACDSEFSGLLENINQEEAQEAIVEVFSALRSDNLSFPKTLTPRACLVVSIIQQLLVRLLTKKLMNLMTAEAVILYRNKIPHSYLRDYLNCQAHFSFKDIITRYYTGLVQEAG